MVKRIRVKAKKPKPPKDCEQRCEKGLPCPYKDETEAMRYGGSRYGKQ